MARQSWIDPDSNEVLIDDYAKRLDSFTDAFADGVIETSELEAQEKRVVELLQEVEGEVDDALHEKLTKLLCELTAFNMMQTFHELIASRPKTTFRG